MSAEEPKTAPVSVVIPCFRCSKTIERAVSSVARQTALPLEVVLVDDHSGDGTLAVLEHLAGQYPQGWIRIVALPENVGVGGARNAGWNASSGEYVAFLDADDAWHPRKTELQHQYVASRDQVVLCGHRHKILDGTSDLPDWEIGSCRGEPVSRLSLFLSNPFVTPSVMIRRDVPYRFLDGRRHMEDHLLWMQIACAGLPVINLSAELAAIYKLSFGEGGLSSNIRAMGQADLANYRQIYREGGINLVQLTGLVIYSMLKHLRRLGILQLRKLLRSSAQQKPGWHP